MKSIERQKGNGTAELLGAIAVLVTIVLAVIGWITNLVAVFHSGPFSTWAAKEILRVIGIFIPIIGAVIGYF